MVRLSGYRLIWVLVSLTCTSHVSATELCVSQSDSRTELALCGSEPFHSTESTVTDPRLISVAGSEVVLILWNETVPVEGTVPLYAISLDGRDVTRVRRTSYDVKLKAGHFDPAIETPQVQPSLAADELNELYIVQFVTQPPDDLPIPGASVAAGPICESQGIDVGRRGVVEYRH